MDRQEILLREYEVCEQDNNSTSSNYWTTIQIFLGVITAFLAAISFALATQTLDVWGLILVIIFSLTVIAIIVTLVVWLKRVGHLIGINSFRMREIEAELGMRKSGIFWGLDHWDKIPVSYRKNIAKTWGKDEQEIDEICNITEINKIPKIYKIPKIPPTAGKIIRALLIIIGVPWGLIIIFAILKFALVN